MRNLIATIMLVLLPTLASAQAFKMEPGPKSPADSLKCIQARPGFKVELMVSEPLVMDPIAFAWGPDGKFWVVEMGDYPLGVDGNNKPGGRIKYLEKSRADGPYDKMTLFMDNVGYPTGVFPHGKGILVTCAPDIFYAEVGKDGKATAKKILFTGFKEGNQQHRVNGLVWGVDNWIYGANGDSGGVVKSTKTGESVDIRGRDFRFKVETGEFEAVSGQSQFGRCRDDWGNWFGCNNSNPMFHFVLEDRYLKRNPHVLYPDVRVPVSVKPGAAPVYPISTPLPRFNTPQGLNHFTSACSTLIYRDNLFGPGFEGNMFVSEPVHNLIHREIMKPRGVTFTSQRADDEQTSEFLASSDNWFRPAMIQVGPDGALWIADMYRYVIEHPEWIPKDWQKKLDLRAGHDKGRIYRVYPEGKTPRAIPRLDKLKVKDLAAQLESPSGWVRDAAQQLLVMRMVTGTLNGVERADALRAIAQIAVTSKNPRARLHAIQSFEELGGWDRETILVLLKDPHPAIRKQVIVMAERFGLNLSPGIEQKYLDALERDPDDQVRQQLAYSLGHSKDSHRLAFLLSDNAAKPHIVAAGLSSISNQNWKQVRQLIDVRDISPTLFTQLMRLARAVGEPLDPSRLFVRRLQLQDDNPASMQVISSVGELLDALDQNNLTLKKLLTQVGEQDVKGTVTRLGDIHHEAVAIMQSPKRALSEKMLALRLLGRGLGNDRDDHRILVALLTPRTPDDVQGAVITQISRGGGPLVPGVLLAPWKSYSPALRGQVLDTLLSRPTWTMAAIDALKRKQIAASEVDAIRRQRLLIHKDADVRAAASTLFRSASNADRDKVFNDYWIRLPAKTDPERGTKLFAKACATCHKLGGVGQNVGPDLASVGDKSPTGLLAAILDPNRAVESRYINYLAVTKNGLSYNGLLAAETSTTITLIGVDGKERQLLRNELDELTSSGKSLMPEGMEKELSPQDLADIIAHIRRSTQTPRRAGSTPRTERANQDGVFVLPPTSSAMFGKSLIIEKKHGNLGYWSNPEDHVVWTVDVQKPGKYDVWIYYACDDRNADNTLAVSAAGSSFTHRIASTGSWDEYRGERIGELILQAGTQEVTFRPAGRLRGSLLDLKKVELSPR